MGIRAFMPASHFDIRYSENLSNYVNTKVNVEVIEFDPEKERLLYQESQCEKGTGS